MPATVSASTDGPAPVPGRGYAFRVTIEATRFAGWPGVIEAYRDRLPVAAGAARQLGDTP